MYCSWIVHFKKLSVWQLNNHNITWLKNKYQYFMYYSDGHPIRSPYFVVFIGTSSVACEGVLLRACGFESLICSESWWCAVFTHNFWHCLLAIDATAYDETIAPPAMKAQRDRLWLKDCPFNRTHLKEEEIEIEMKKQFPLKHPCKIFSGTFKSIQSHPRLVDKSLMVCRCDSQVVVVDYVSGFCDRILLSRETDGC